MVDRDFVVKKAAISRRLLAWFKRHRREMPWRKTKDPYRIWLSEIMLQQTQVATVIPYYERFVSRYPTVQSLASAPQDDVLQLWSGLGYYARARNIHRAAKELVSKYGGVFPNNVETLCDLPGIGKYTAGAIASIAFGIRAPLVDGNVARVLARVMSVRKDLTDGGMGTIWNLAERLLPARRCGDFNEALMELGATVCLPGASAKCSICPLRLNCKAFADRTVSMLPVKTRRTLVRYETHVVSAVHRDGRWLIAKRPLDGLWGGLWEFPTAVSEKKASSKFAEEIANRHGLVVSKVETRPFCRLTHQLTHRRIEFAGYVCESAAIRAKVKKGEIRSQRWVTLKQAQRMGISTAMRSVMQELCHYLDL